MRPWLLATFTAVTVLTLLNMGRNRFGDTDSGVTAREAKVIAQKVVANAQADTVIIPPAGDAGFVTVTDGDGRTLKKSRIRDLGASDPTSAVTFSANVTGPQFDTDLVNAPVINGETFNLDAAATISRTGGDLKLDTPNVLCTGDLSCQGVSTKQLNTTRVIKTAQDLIDLHSPPPTPGVPPTPFLAGSGQVLLLPGGKYAVEGQVEVNFPILCLGDTSFIGLARDGETRSALNWVIDYAYQSPNALFFSAGNVSFTGLYLSAYITPGTTFAATSFLRLQDATEQKILTLTNCRVGATNTPVVLDVEGYDLIDINQTLFMYNFPSLAEFRITRSSKVQVSSCEFLRGFQEGSNVPTIDDANYGTGAMIQLVDWVRAVNISSSFFHPRKTQKGIDFSGLQQVVGPPPAPRVLEALVVGCTFISVGLTTGVPIDYGTGGIDTHSYLTVEGNTGVLNQKAAVELSLVGNTTFTPTVAGVSVPVVWGAYTVPISRRFTVVSNSGETRCVYTGKKQITALVSASVACDHDTKGNDDILVRYAVTNTPANTVTFSSAFQLDIEDGKVRAFNFSKLLVLNQNDGVELYVQNVTAGTDNNGFRAVSINLTIVEI